MNTRTDEIVLCINLKFKVEAACPPAPLAKPIIVSDFFSKCISTVVINFPFLWLIYLFPYAHNFLFTTSCFISWPFTKICGRRRRKKRWTHSNRRRRSQFSFALAFAFSSASRFMYWNTCVIYSFVFSLRNQFRSVLTYVLLTFSLNYNDGVFSFQDFWNSVLLLEGETFKLHGKSVHFATVSSLRHLFITEMPRQRRKWGARASCFATEILINFSLPLLPKLDQEF